MPHTTTKNHRPKRPDARPNGKRRKQERTAVMEKLEAKDIIATRIPKALHKERRVTGDLKQPQKPSDVIRLRSLQKLYRQIKNLEEKKIFGEVLDAQQLEKLGRLDSVIAELEEFLVDDDSDEDGEEEQAIADNEEREEEDEEEEDATHEEGKEDENGNASNVNVKEFQKRQNSARRTRSSRRSS